MIMEKEVKNTMGLAIDHLKQELKSIRTGRANPGILDSITVEVYGAPMRLRDIANITVPESRQLLITPFDANNTSAIGKAIANANLNLQAITDGNAVRINIPQMDESGRKDMVKQCKKKAEEAKIVVREIRRKFNEEARKQKSEGEITEDMQKKSEKMIQEFTDKFCKDIDIISAGKEKEILEI
jgi:ribosome recycling factor